MRRARQQTSDDAQCTRNLSWRELAFVYGLSLLPRVIWAVWAHATPLSDMREYDQLAMQLLGTGRFGLEGYLTWRTPVYPAMLAGVYGMVGHHVRAAMLLHVFLGAMTSVLLALLAARLISRRAGLLAGVIHALSVTSILYVPLLVTEHVAVPLVVGALLSLTVMAGGKRAGAWAGLAGLLLGLAILVRPACAFFLPGALAVAGYDFGARRWRLPLAGAILLALALPLLAWVARNVRVGVGPVLSSSGDFILYMGTQSDDPTHWREDKLWEEFPSEAERSRIWRRAALHWIAGHPVGYLRLCGGRVWKLLGPQGDGYVAYWAWPTRANDALLVSYWQGMPFPGEVARPPPAQLAAQARELRARNARALSWPRAVAWPFLITATVLGLRRWRTLSPVVLPTFSYVLLLLATYVSFRLRELAGPGVVVMMAALGEMGWTKLNRTGGGADAVPSQRQRGAAPPRGQAGRGRSLTTGRPMRHIA